MTYRASNRGRARLYVDGVLKTTLTLTSSTVKGRNIAYTITFAASGTHTIKVVVYSGRVDVDAFVVLRQAAPRAGPDSPSGPSPGRAPAAGGDRC